MARSPHSTGPAGSGLSGSRLADRPAGHGLGTLRRLAPFLRPYWPAAAGAGIALVIAAGTVLALGQGLRRLIDQGFSQADGALLDQAFVILLVVVVVLAGATYARFYLVSWIGERVVADLRRAVFERVIALGPAFYEVTRTGEVISRLTTDTTLLQTLVGSTVSVALRNVLLLIGGSVLLAVTSPRLTGFVFLVLPFVVLPIIILGRRVRRHSRWSQDRVADVAGYLDETLHAVRTVQAFNHEPHDRRQFSTITEAAVQAALVRVRWRALLTGLVIVLVFGAVAAILWQGGYDVLEGRMSAGELSAFIFYAIVVAGAVGAVSEVAGDLQRAAGATERLMELLAMRPDIAVPDHPVALPQPAQGAVAFDSVTFRYPAAPQTAALDDVSFTIAPGETIALVGPSGAGKTTVFQMLLRFYDPASGTVRLDGVDLRQADPAVVRRRIGLVPQEPVLFAADAWENIRYGRPEASDREVEAAAEAAAAGEFLRRLPQGFATHLGEKGVRLSGGQRQRIAIARAILRDPALLLLDEATSALDAESERLIQQALERLRAGRTTLVIAHRLATVRKADRIIVLDAGRMVATGRHDALVAEGGLYARLAALQFSDRAA